MSDSNRNRHDAIVAFAITVCLLIVGLIGWYQGFEVGQESHQTYSAEAYENQSDREIADTCAGLTASAERECIAKAIRTAREQQRSEQDLDAQQQMSEWAKWMLVATIIMAVITLFGVVFVWQTLVATQGMAKDTRDIGEAQVRAYLDITGVFFEPHSEDDDVKEFNFSFHVVNNGQTPAFEVEYAIRVTVGIWMDKAARSTISASASAYLPLPDISCREPEPSRISVKLDDFFKGANEESLARAMHVIGKIKVDGLSDVTHVCAEIYIRWRDVIGVSRSQYRRFNRASLNEEGPIIREKLIRSQAMGRRGNVGQEAIEMSKILDGLAGQQA